jgi:hypothetical protein
MLQKSLIDVFALPAPRLVESFFCISTIGKRTGSEHADLKIKNGGPDEKALQPYLYGPRNPTADACVFG